MLIKKVCKIDNDETRYLITSEPAMNPNGYFCVVVLSLLTGKFKTIKCDSLTLELE